VTRYRAVADAAAEGGDGEVGVASNACGLGAPGTCAVEHAAMNSAAAAQPVIRNGRRGFTVMAKNLGSSAPPSARDVIYY